ncbi:MAG: membrane protein insertion efficiency factor YidD [Candidatus Nitronauta litoralis]|uniref:Putative membrane protein insertion efficiency factor n=1 Tax=Candidatus Nitronauta litoralis TaxID=2705533 RepID=A0A7T0BWH6_9BACT|nr:MAG: membrane protein insertion efficiency factor YidD [Candidatus Nitronauta litoralis]
MINSILKTGVRGYRYLVSPLMGPCCRFNPTCSHFALEALDRFPFWRAIPKIFLRISKCHPFHKGGYDPVN